MTNTFTIGLLATAVSASLAMANGGEEEKNKFQDKSPVSFKAGDGITFDGGDNFSLNLKNRLQIQYTYDFGDDVDDAQNFDIRRARTNLSGHAFNKNLHYNLMLDWAQDENNIKDAWAQWDFVNNANGKVGLRLGQSKTFHGLESTGSSAGLYFAERSDAADFYSVSRSRGVWLHGNHMESKFRWTAGAQNNGVAKGVDGDDTADNSDNELVYVASANIDPMGDFVGGGNTYEKYMQGDLEGSSELKGTFGAGIALDDRDTNATGVVIEVDGEDPLALATTSTQYNLNTAWRVSHFWAQAEYFSRTDEAGDTEYDHDGYTISVGYTLPKSGDSNLQWGLGARYSNRTPDQDVALDLEAAAEELQGTVNANGKNFDEIKELTLGINAFYHGHKCKTMLNFVNTEDKTTDQDEQAIVVQFQIII